MNVSAADMVLVLCKEYVNFKDMPRVRVLLAKAKAEREKRETRRKG